MRHSPPLAIEGARATIYGCVTTIPGVHLRSVERRTGLPLGQVLYHLDRLERMGLIVSARDAGFRRYYPSREVGRGEKRYLAALRHDVPRRVILALLETGTLTHKDLQAQLKVAGSTLSFHLQRLLTSGVLVRDRQGTSNHYRLEDAETARRELIYYRESFQDSLVDAYVRRALDALPPLPHVASPPPPAPADGRPGEREDPHVELVPS